MDGAEAKSILAKELAEFAARPYDKLVLLIDNPGVKNVGGYSGENYQIEFEVSRIRNRVAICALWLRSMMAAGARLCRSPIL
jgi:hypothetical protein